MEQVIEKNPSGKTSAQQGSVIPLGWKPSRAAPVPVIRCVQIRKNGERCKRWSLRGYDRCKRHAGPGAHMPDGNVIKYIEAVRESARLRLVDDTDEALDVLLELMQPGTSEGIRLKAAESVLDRAGVKGGIDINVDVQVTENPSDQIARRLSKLAEGAAHVEQMKRRAREEATAPTDVEDAEIVPDQDGQEALF